METANNTTALLSSLSFYPTKDQAFENGQGDNIYQIDGMWTCISRNDPRNIELAKAGFKTDYQIYLEWKAQRAGI